MRPKEHKISNTPKRITLSGIQKKELCKMKHDNPSLAGVQLAKKYGIGEQSVLDILKRSEFWLNLHDDFVLAQTKRQRKVNYPNIKEAWVERAIWNRVTITDHIFSERVCRSVGNCRI